jgi:hypothetical protein
MTYEDAIAEEVTREEARREIAKHDCEGFEQFLRDVGDKPTYAGREVLDWLGY